MKLYVSEMYNGKNMETTLLGVFDTMAKAEAAGTKYGEDMEYNDFELIDDDTEYLTHIRYYTNQCTLMVTECELNQPL